MAGEMTTTAGSCLCGDVALEFSGEPLGTAVCHCIDCQKWSGGAFTTSVVVPRESFKVTKGMPTSWDSVGGSGKPTRRFFCGRCGSSLYSELDAMPGQTIVKAGGLDGGAAGLGGAVGVEVYTKDRAAYLRPCEGAKQEPAFRP